jgi:lipid A 3-O-deacylase
MALGVLTLAAMFGGYPLMDAPAQRIAEFGVDRLAPTKADRDLDTTDVHLYLRQKQYDPLRLQLRLGATLSRVTGSITQLTGSLEEGTLREETLSSPAWGIGPSAEARFALLRGAPASLDLDFSAAVLLYDRDFPAGGKRYNGMFQIGPSLTFALGSGAAFSLGYRWMHVSNGRDLGLDNPAYDARGVTLRYRLALG